MATANDKSISVLVVLLSLNLIFSEPVLDTSLCELCQCTESEVTCNSLLTAEALLNINGSDIKYLTIMESDLRNLRQEHFSRFQNVSGVTIKSSNVNFNSSSLSLLTEVLELNLDNNSIEGIVPGMFDKNQKLRNLSLNNNEIKHLMNDSFKNLQQLKRLLLANNSIEEIESGTFVNLSSLEELDLSGNRLLRVEASALAPLRSLRLLRLGRNHLASFSPALVELLARSSDLSAQLEPNPLRCDCGELRAAWAAATARGLHLRLSCASGQPWDDVMRSLNCTGADADDVIVQDGDDASSVIVGDTTDESSEISTISIVADENSDVQENLSIVSNSTSSTNITIINLPEEDHTDEDVDVDPAAVAAAAEGEVITDTLLQAFGDDESDEKKDKELSPAQTAALAEGILIAGALWQVVNGSDSSTPSDEEDQFGDLSPAEAVAVAEGVEIVDSLVEAANEMGPSVNAIWRATLEAEASWKQQDVSEGEESLDTALITLFGIVMLVMSITGTVAGIVLYSRLHNTPYSEDEQSHNMYVLVDDSDTSASKCQQNPAYALGIHYTFPDIEREIVS